MRDEDAQMCKQSRWTWVCTTTGTNRKVETVGRLGKMGEMGRGRSGQGKRTRVYVRVAFDRISNVYAISRC